MSENIEGGLPGGGTDGQEKKPGYLRGLSGAKKYCWGLVAVFVVFWAFYLGFAVSAAILPEQEWVVTAKDIVWTLPDDTLPPPPKELEGTIVFLLTGSDQRAGSAYSGNADTIIVAFLNVDNKELKLLSLPRDTYVYRPGLPSNGKINTTFANGVNEKASAELLKKSTELLLGVKIDYYIDVRFSGFVQMIDAIGGIYLDVELDMFHIGDDGEVDIDLKIGKNQLLNGAQALGYVRFREYPSGMADLERISHQQEFIKQLAKQSLRISNLTKTPQLINILIKNVNTDLPSPLTSNVLFEIIDVFLSHDFAGVEGFLLPGRFSTDGRYWLVDENALRANLVKITGWAEEDFDIRIPEQVAPNPVPHGGLKISPWPINPVPEDGSPLG
ncbi:MAG: LCP family protein [Clostridiales bacterium]|nr:LCP family protein [Clostridiales bacterium]